VSVSKHWKPGKKSVDLQPEVRPSRIRRDPVPLEKPSSLGNNAWWESRAWEIRLAIIGIIFFALAINAVVFDIGEFLSR
jgi:hypothetical protein